MSRTPRTRNLALALVAAGGLALSACASAGTSATSVPTDPQSSATTHDETEPETSPTAQDGTASATPTTPSELQGAEGSQVTNAEEFTTADTQGGNGQGGGDLLPVEVRSADHEAHSRVVVEFEGDGEPGWAAGYVDEAVEQGRGNVIDVPGAVTLAVTLRGLTYPEGDAQIDAMVSGAMTSNASAVEGLHLDPMFEGQAVLYIGLDSERPYAVTTLGDPQRVVIDILNE